MRYAASLVVALYHQDRHAALRVPDHLSALHAEHPDRCGDRDHARLVGGSLLNTYIHTYTSICCLLATRRVGDWYVQFTKEVNRYPPPSLEDAGIFDIVQYVAACHPVAQCLATEVARALTVRSALAVVDGCHQWRRPSRSTCKAKCWCTLSESRGRFDAADRLARARRSCVPSRR